MGGVRRLAAILLGTAAAVLGVAGGAPAQRQAGDLLPNLVELPPSELAVVAGPAGARPAARWEVTFTSTAGNAGQGALVVRSTRGSAAAAWRSVQVIEQAGGGTRTLPLPVTVRWEARAGHEHFHIARFERYELVGPAGVIAFDSKAGYCLGDRWPLGTAGAPKPRFVTFCGRGAPGLRTLLQGISRGWSDPYRADLPGQSFPIGSLPAGDYTIVNRVNDQGLYRELTIGDNVAATVFRLAWPDGAAGRPVVQQLRTCLAERCPAG